MISIIYIVFIIVFFSRLFWLQYVISMFLVYQPNPYLTYFDFVRNI